MVASWTLELEAGLELARQETSTELTATGKLINLL